VNPDVLIIGAGAAGLTSALELTRAGLRVEVLEGRDRVGGRIFTQNDPLTHSPVELGAEFVHGLAPEIWEPVQKHKLAISEVEGDLWCARGGQLEPCDFFGKAEKILSAMDDKHPDESFLKFLARRFPGNEQREGRQRATAFVSGFNAADPDKVSVHWLVHSREADAGIEGDRAFHIHGGYQKLISCFVQELTSAESAGAPPLAEIHLGTKVRRVLWQRASVRAIAETKSGKSVFNAPRIVITLPLGVLQNGAVVFDPALPGSKQQALQKLAMGKVVRVTLCFRRRFWENLRPNDGQKSLAGMSFLFSDDELFPTWWTQMPAHPPVITGWSPEQSAERLAGMTKEQIVARAMESLSGLLGQNATSLQHELGSAYLHDWDSDPFSCGAYSYVKAGGEGCQHGLGEAVERTLFFAGEATDISGHNGTVHGAIASGRRAAAEVLAAA
jgi:monoamine oxidase